MIVGGDDERVLALTLTVSGQFARKTLLSWFTEGFPRQDTSDYPKNHSLFAFTEDDLPSELQNVVEDIASASSRPLSETIRRLLISVALARKPSSHGRADSPIVVDSGEEDGDEDDDEQNYDYEAYDEYEAVGTSNTSILMKQMPALQS